MQRTYTTPAGLTEKELTARFLIVRDSLKALPDKSAYLACFKKPWKFYRVHTPEEAIEILIKEFNR